MNTIGDLLSRDLTQPIEEVIKLDQRDEQTVHDEITEYVATDRIKEQYIKVLEPIAEGPGDPSEAVGVWVSGFFGSGKSSFAKILGYILANRELLGTPASQLFIQQLQEQSPGDPQVGRIKDLLNFITARIPTHAILFDVQVDRAVRRANESIAEILYSVLLRELDYAQDYDVANLEIELEAEGRLAEFIRACAELYADQVSDRAPQVESVPVTLEGVSPEDYAMWRMVRKGAQKIQRTSNTLNHIDPQTYPNPDSWAQSLHARADINIRTLVDRTFELASRRKPGHAIVFVVDEVGQYVARSAEKIENLRAVVEHFGQESKNRVLAGSAIAPVWMIVTSQEKLDEVVAAIDDKRVQLARLQDRFRYRIDMAPADIREVATKRVLSKTPQAEEQLRDLYKQFSGQLKTHTQPERSQINFDVSQDDFVQFYPYLPHFVELSIDIVSGMRLQAGAPRHIGGSNRTIIKQAYEMLVSDRTKLADAPVGALVTLDKIYDLVEGNLPSERQRDITDIHNLWPADPWPSRTAKAIVLLEYVRGLPRTERNLASLLFDALDAGSRLDEVQAAIQKLEDRQFIRQTEEGWKLLTEQEKSWTTERNSLNPAPKERRDIWEDRLREIFNEPGLSRYKLKNRTFQLDVNWEGRTLRQGEVPLELRSADDYAGFQKICEEVRKQSREKNKRVFWVFASTDELDDQVAELYRSRQMVAKYEQLRAQNKINVDESASLSTEKLDVTRREERVKRLLAEALQHGAGYFDGVEKRGPDLGKSTSEIFKAMFDYSVPKLYPKLEMGTRPVTSKEAEEILKAANLNGLSKVFYGGDEGLNLVISEDGKYVVNTQAKIAKEVTGYIQGQHEYGNKVTGRMLEDHFGGLGYGWDREILWIVLASLLRAGAVEVTYQGRRFRNHLDAQVRAAFSATNAFRSASFAPRKPPDLQAMVSAVRRYEDLTGEEVDVDESAIAQAFQNLARTEMNELIPVEAVVNAHKIPVGDVLDEFRNTLTTIIQGASDDVVNILAGEGQSFKRLRQQVNEIKQATNEAGLNRLRRARMATAQIWPLLAERGQNSGLAETAGELRDHLEEGSYYKLTEKVDRAIQDLEGAYRDLYEKLHAQRGERYQAAIDRIKGLPEWTELEGDVQQSVLSPLLARSCQSLKLPTGELVCENCRASLPQMESDLAAVDGLRQDAVQRIRELLKPEEKVERVRIAQVVGSFQTLNTVEEVDEALNRLRDHLHKLIESGIKVILE